MKFLIEDLHLRVTGHNENLCKLTMEYYVVWDSADYPSIILQKVFAMEESAVLEELHGGVSGSLGYQ